MSKSSDNTGSDLGYADDIAVETKDQDTTQSPKMYRVLLLNDDYTTMEFVVQILMQVFHHSEENAMKIMLHVHHRGVGVAGIFTYEVAETKVSKVRELAQRNEFPLRCTMEPQ